MRPLTTSGEMPFASVAMFDLNCRDCQPGLLFAMIEPSRLSEYST